MFILVGNRVINAGRMTKAGYEAKGNHGNVYLDQSRLVIEFGDGPPLELRGEEADQTWQALQALVTGSGGTP
jgi:hypothetical protein